MSKHYRMHDQAYPHFVTSATIHWIPIFRREDYFQILVDSLKHCVENRGLLVHGYVLMPDHFHVIASQQDGKLSQVLGQIKGYTAHLIAPKIAEDGRVAWLRAIRRPAGDGGAVTLWQDDLHPEQVYSRAFFEQKLEYIHKNPVVAGYVEDPCAWKYSSAGFYYADRPSPVPVTVPEL